MSFRLYKLLSVLISFITGDCFVIRLPDLFSCNVSTQLKSPPVIIIVSCVNSSSCLLSLLKKVICWATSFGA